MAADTERADGLVLIPAVEVANRQSESIPMPTVERAQQHAALYRHAFQSLHPREPQLDAIVLADALDAALARNLTLAVTVAGDYSEAIAQAQAVANAAIRYRRAPGSTEMAALLEATELYETQLGDDAP